MKLSVACLTCLACYLITTSLFAQGQINWANTSGTLISVNGLLMPVRVSPATTYYFGLFIAPFGTPAPLDGIAGIGDPNWQYAAAYATNSTAGAGAGRIQNPGTSTVAAFAMGTSVNFIVRVWQSSSGGADWAAARPGLFSFGQSAVGTAVLGGGAIRIPDAFGTDAGEIGGFNVWGCTTCFPPWFVVSPSNTSATLGSDVTLYSQAMVYGGGLGYQWRKGGAPLPAAVSSVLHLTNVALSDSGNYDVVASNFYGSAVSAPATLTVFIPAIPATLSSPTYTVGNQFRFTVTGSPGSNYVVQVATNLSAPTVWVSLFTNASPFTFVDSNAQNFPQRFYRAQAR